MGRHLARFAFCETPNVLEEAVCRLGAVRDGKGRRATVGYRLSVSSPIIITMRQRFGIGYDSHVFGAKRPLVLGGVEIENDTGLKGHSDGDAVAHAVIDALLGSVAMGDIV